MPDVTCALKDPVVGHDQFLGLIIRVLLLDHLCYLCIASPLSYAFRWEM